MSKTFFPGVGSGGGLGATTFTFSNYGGVDDDVTDNCANGSVAAFNAAVNAYTGPGQPVVIIGPGSFNKAYKLATNSNSCHFEFDIPVTLYLTATLDCAQTAGNCIQIGSTSLPVGNSGPSYFILGGGTLVGGASLTTAGIEIEPHVVNTIIDGLNFLNFGAGNGTLGACTNFAIQFDANLPEGTVSHTQWTQTDSTFGRCGYNNVGSPGQNTIIFADNTLGGGSAGGVSNGSSCSSVLIQDGGFYGIVRGNNLFAGGIDLRLTGVGTRVENNTIDAVGCANSGVNAPFQWGGRSATTAVAQITVANNNIGGGGNGTLFAKAGDTNGGSTITDISIIGNSRSNNATASNVIDGSSCTVSANQGNPCYVGGNLHLQLQVPTGTTNAGWCLGNLCGQLFPALQSANLGSTLLVNAPTQVAYYATCSITLKTAATTSSTLPQCVVSWTDSLTSTAQSVTITPVWASGTVGCNGSATNTAGNSCTATFGPIVPAAGAAVNISTSNYASSGATAMQYQLFANLLRAG